MNLLPSVIILLFLWELWDSHFSWIPDTCDAYVALCIYNQVEFIILRQVNNIFKHTGNFDVDSLDGWKFTVFA